MKIENATIDGTFLGTEHGSLTFTLSLRFGNGVQSYGGYGMDRWDAAAKVNIGLAFGSAAIRSILHVVGVNKWEDLKGKNVRTRTNGVIVGLGHIMEERWVSLHELAKEYNEMEEAKA